MAEQDQRRTIVRVLRSLDAVSVENPAYPGTPDVNYIGGWVELKWLRRWPERGGVVQLEHYTQQQRVWHIRRCRAGGACWVLLQVGRCWLLFWGRVAAKFLGQVEKEQLLSVAYRVWENGLKKEELLECLTNCDPQSLNASFCGDGGSV